MPNDLRTEAIVLRRTNYGESDRILNLLTPEGKLSVLARGARKEKSKLAGGIELFSVADIVVHQGRSSLGTLTSAKMLHFYNNILSDLSRLELASNFLKKADRAAEQIDNPDYFSLTNQALRGLHQNLPTNLIQAWFTLSLAQAMGEEINLATDISGNNLISDAKYIWDHAESALRMEPNGYIGAPEIKLARLMLTSNLEIITRINNAHELVRALSPLVHAYE